MRLEIGAGLVALGLVVYGPVLTALTLPKPPERERDCGPAVTVHAEADREPASGAALVHDLQDGWRARIGATYRDADVLFDDRGNGYVRPEERVAIDRGFLDELGTVYGAEARAAQVYALAHAMGHHVERQLGVTADPIALELEADCLAGVWARSTGALARSDARAAVAHATAIAGDRRARLGTEPLDDAPAVSTEARVEALERGLSTLDLSVCAPSESAADRALSPGAPRDPRGSLR